MEEVRSRRGSWIFLGAVSGVRLTTATGFEYRVAEVHLVSSRHLARRRRRFGIEPAVSELRRRHAGALDHFFERQGVVAILRRKGKLSEIEPKLVQLVREELLILAASQLGSMRRKYCATPNLSSNSPHRVMSNLVLNVDQYAWSHPIAAIGRLGDLNLDERWVQFANGAFFSKALRAIRGDVTVDRSWRRDLRKALILLGQSLTSVDLPMAFLWNMIALELLLTRRGDDTSRELPRRAEAFLGWTVDWKTLQFTARLRELYAKRNRLVHQGEQSHISSQDVVFLDELLLNVLTNIVGHPRLFASKEGLVKFSAKVDAERVLGLKPKVRPKTLRYLRKRPSQSDLTWE